MPLSNVSLVGLGYEGIDAIYESSSADYADEVEDMAIQHLMQNYPGTVKNEKGGGGGPDGARFPKLVYVAWKA